MQNVKVHGTLLGARGDEDMRIAVIVSREDCTPVGPAENAYFVVDYAFTPPRARYVSWINLYDIEHAAKFDPSWKTIEPARCFSAEVEWRPYGWAGETLPSVAD